MRVLEYGDTSADKAEVMEEVSSLIPGRDVKDGVNAAVLKGDVIYLKIKSLHLMPNYRFLSLVFDVFSRYKIPVSMVTTSEVCISVAIDDEGHLEDIMNELQDYAVSEVSRDMVIISVPVCSDAQNTCLETWVVDALKEIPVRMISYGGSSNGISLVVRTCDRDKVLESLNRNLYLI